MQPAGNLPALIPQTLSQVRRNNNQSAPGHRVLPKQINGQALQPGSELATRLDPEDHDLFNPTHQTTHVRHLGLNQGRKLAGVQVSNRWGF